MKNNILIIIIVTLVAIGVIAAVILTGAAKGKDSSSASNSIPDWGGSSENSQSADPQNESSSVVPPFSSDVSSGLGDSDSSSSVTASSSPTDPQDSSSGSEYGAADGIVATANSLIGVPFVMGGANPDGFDNPGFIYYVLRENGFHNCSRSIAKQSEMGRQLTYSELKSGDLVFFYNDGEDTVGFGGIYIGDGKMIASLTPPDSEHGVMIEKITTPYYQRNFYCGVSLS